MQPGRPPACHCSANERRADEASRDVEAWLKCRYMREHLGEEYGGTVSAVTSFGLFVTLDGCTSKAWSTSPSSAASTTASTRCARNCAASAAACATSSARGCGCRSAGSTSTAARSTSAWCATAKRPHCHARGATRRDKSAHGGRGARRRQGGRSRGAKRPAKARAPRRGGTGARRRRGTKSAARQGKAALTRQGFGPALMLGDRQRRMCPRADRGHDRAPRPAIAFRSVPTDGAADDDSIRRPSGHRHRRRRRPGPRARARARRARRQGRGQRPGRHGRRQRRRADAAQEVVDEIKAAGGEAIANGASVTDDAGVQRDGRAGDGRPGAASTS